MCYVVNKYVSNIYNHVWRFQWLVILRLHDCCILKMLNM